MQCGKRMSAPPFGKNLFRASPGKYVAARAVTRNRFVSITVSLRQIIIYVYFFIMTLLASEKVCRCCQ